MIPLAKDTREAVGVFADKVENRSLLFEKMVLAKTWGHPARFSEANRFNVLRASTNGAVLLQEDRDAAQRKANSPHATEHVKTAAAYLANVAGSLAGGAMVDSPDLIRRQTENANELLALMERAHRGRVKTFVATLGGRLLINMAGGVMENAGIALDRCFGLPYIPGSAVKGVARNAALWDIYKTPPPGERILKLRHALMAFGFIRQDIKGGGDFRWAAGDDALIAEALGELVEITEFKGLLSFLPAKPTDTKNLRIVAEVITPHPKITQHPKDRDPRPLFFPAVEAGSSFGFVILAQRKVNGVDVAIDEILCAAESWLKDAITKSGVGAKTGSGFGWFEIDPEAEKKRRSQMKTAHEHAEKKEREAAEARRKETDEEARIASLSPEALAVEQIASLEQQEYAAYAKTLTERNEVEQRAFLKTLMSKEHKTTRKSWKKRKPVIWDAVQQVAGQLNVSLT